MVLTAGSRKEECKCKAGIQVGEQERWTSFSLFFDGGELLYLNHGIKWWPHMIPLLQLLCILINFILNTSVDDYFDGDPTGAFKN